MTPRQSHQLEHMRGLLRVQGIVLDEATEVSPTATPSPQTAEGVDRDEVLRILVEAGAPAKDLEWLTDSCPSIEAARRYRPPRRVAWCFACDAATSCDDAGCLDCRGAA